jgi:heptaprenyl diphosphate synthase
MVSDGTIRDVATTWRDVRAPDDRLERDLRARLDEVEAALASAVTSDLPLVSEAAGYLLEAGGKRFRPLLVLLGGRFGQQDDPRLVPAAVAIELTHLATLYHDDVIDEARDRRGIASANARWDNTVAILTGDFLFARASLIASDLGTETTRLLARTIAEVCEGQIREVQIMGRVDTDEAGSLDVIRRKTASLIGTSCRLGGLVSDADPGVLDRPNRSSRSLGLAFQLSDDIMDLTADRAVLGKEPGADLREGVYTLPVIHALADAARREELRALLAGGPPSGERLEAALDIVRADGSLDRSRSVVTEAVRSALDQASGLPAGPAADALAHLARFIAARCGAEL